MLLFATHHSSHLLIRHQTEGRSACGASYRQHHLSLAGPPCPPTSQPCQQTTPRVPAEPPPPHASLRAAAAGRLAPSGHDGVGRAPHHGRAAGCSPGRGSVLQAQPSPPVIRSRAEASNRSEAPPPTRAGLGTGGCRCLAVARPRLPSANTTSTNRRSRHAGAGSWRGWGVHAPLVTLGQALPRLEVVRLRALVLLRPHRV